MKEMQATSSAEMTELNDNLIEEYLDELASRGRNQETVKTYNRCLRELRSFLLRENLPLSREAVTLWHDSLEKSGLSVSSVNVRMSSAKGVLEYAGILPAALPRESAETKQSQPIPTRTEYLRLLYSICAFGTRQEYFLVKIFGQIGLDMREMPRLTVEACQAGEVTGSNGQTTPIPAGLCRELLQYAAERGIASGPVMVTQSGRPIHRANINHMLNHAAEKAGLPPEKFTPSALARMCRRAQNDIWKKLEPLYIQSYEHLLDTEQAMVVWSQES